MKLKQVALAAALAVTGASAFAVPSSTFIDNLGVHAASESGGDSWEAGASVADKFTFTLATAVSALNSEVAFVPTGMFSSPAVGTVSLFSASSGLIAAYTFADGFKSFGAQAAGDYFYTVTATSSSAGSFSFNSYITPVPEPETYALMLAGLGVMGFVARRRKG